MLLTTMTLRETIAELTNAQQDRASRFWFKSPCYFIKTSDFIFHILLPELIEDVLPALSRWLRVQSPRWGRSWRGWEETP